MSRLTIRSAATPPDVNAVRTLCWEYRAYLFERNPQDRTVIETFYPEAYYATLMDRLEIEHATPQGVILVAELDNTIVGCGMTHQIGPGISEMKRVFVRDHARGHGAGRKICLALMDHARAQGYRLLRLDTSKSLMAARALYTALGFRERGPYYDVPESAKDVVCFYEITL